MTSDDPLACAIDTAAADLKLIHAAFDSLAHNTGASAVQFDEFDAPRSSG